MEYKLYILDDSGKRAYVTWTGDSGEDAAQRYADSHPGISVIGYHEAHRHGLHFGGKGMVIVG